MKISFLKKNALSLIELLIASALVGIIVVGLISVEFAIRKAAQNEGGKN